MSTVEGGDVTAPRRSPWVLPPWGITAVCFAVAFAAVAATVVAAQHSGGGYLSHPLTFVVLTALLVFTHVRPTRLIYRHGTVESDHMDEALFAPMVLMLGPVEIAAAAVLASLAGNIVARRPPLKILFNVSQTLLFFLAGYAVARTGYTSSKELGSPTTLLAAFAGGVVVDIGSSLAVASIVRLSAGHSVLLGMREQWKSRWVPSGGALLLGLLAAVAVHYHSAAAVPAIALGLAMQHAYFAVVVQRQARMAAEALQETVVAIRNSSDPDEILDQLRAAATDVLHAQRVVFVAPDTPTPPRALQATMDEHTALQVTHRIGGGPWHDSERSALSTLATVGAAALRNARLVAQLTAITDSQTEGVLAIDDTGVVTFANPAARRLVACEDLVGQVADYVFAIDTTAGRLDLTDIAASHRGMRHPDAVLSAGSERTPIAFTATGLPEPQTGVVLVIHDITERKAFEEKLTYLAFHDPLTYLPNRRLFEDRLDHALARAERHKTRHALLMVDLDRFKLVNDSYGHPAGDALLVQVAALLRRTLRLEDTCARLGGDEFAVLIEDVTDTQQAADVAQRILEGLAAGCIVDGHDVFVSASIGIATSEQAPSREALVAAADAAAYEAKAAGKGRYHVFAPDTAGDPRARLELEASMRRALEHGEFELYYQPLVDTSTSELVGAEALIRWNSAEGIVSPAKFIPLAEETGLIVPIGAWVLEEACRQGQEWTLAHPDRAPLEISVNLSAHQLSRPNLVGEVDEILQRTGFRPEQLCLEITETVLMRDVESAIRTLRDLKGLGLQVAIDDFGTGYSSLSYLKQFPVDIVKVDRSFLTGLGENPVDSEIVAAVVRLASACGIMAVAEGVETQEQRGLLEELGCPLIQGFLIAEPLVVASFGEFWGTSAATVVPTPRRSPMRPDQRISPGA
jgi:diguanylate cyclase (GGDEF)-like protein/PAS domain S-box-containing protein